MPGIGNPIGTKQPPIHQELSSLGCEADALDKTIDELGTHLQSVMLPDQPEPANESNPRERQSDVTERIITFTLRLRCARMKLASFVSRLEV